MDFVAITENIKKCGFVLEHQVTDLLRAHQWSVINNRYYIDDVQESAREIDLIAYKVNRVENILIYTTLVVSCKKSESNAWSLLFRDHVQDDPNIDWYPMKLWCNDKRLKQMISNPDWKKLYLEEAKTHNIYDKIFEPSGHLFAFQEIDKAKSTIQNDKNIFNSVSSLMKAEAYEMSSLERRKKDISLYSFNLLSIVDSELIKLHFAGNTISPSKVDDARCVFSYIVDKRETSSRIHFCTFDSLERVLESYDKLYQLDISFYRMLLEKFYDNILSDFKRTNVLKKEFEREVLWTYNQFYKRQFSTEGKIENIYFYHQEGAALRIALEVPSEAVEFFNKHERVKATTKNALRWIYRYSGDFVFEEDTIPF